MQRLIVGLLQTDELRKPGKVGRTSALLVRNPQRHGKSIDGHLDTLRVSVGSVKVIRTDLGGGLPAAAGEALVSVVHLSDLHVLDAASPARAEWVELLGNDRVWRPLLHMHRPYDTLTLHALHAHVCEIHDSPVGRSTGRPLDLVISTGDNIDNAQRNELDAYLSMMAGGTARLLAFGSAQDSSGPGSEGPWPYWSPDRCSPDSWRHLGYPAVDDFIERVSAPIESPGLGVAWTSVPGNHDLLRQGTALTNPATESIAVGAVKSLQRPTGFAPTDPLSHYLDAPESFSDGPGFAIVANPDRRAVDRSEWISAHVAAGATGLTATNVATGCADTVIDTEHVRFVLFDTNHPGGDYQGSIGSDQLTWLDERLAEVDRLPGRIAILVSHHGADTLVNERGASGDRHLAAALLDVVHRHGCVVAWLVGHRHINRIEPRPGPAGGFWEITTCSVIDWPSQTRSIEVIRHLDGSFEIASTMIDHAGQADSLATLHRDLAHRFTTTGVATRMAGRAGDGDVRLVVPAR